MLGAAMARPSLSKPTNGELVILRVLWTRGPSTVREIHEVLASGRGTGYTTTLKLLQIMTDKGLATRQEWGRVHRYEAAASEADTLRQLVDDLVERAFGGSAAKLVMQALTTKRASPDELAEIRKLLDKRRGGAR
jgi:predicted transcriptional regulator